MERDFYPTPWEAVPALLPHLKDYQTYAEICAGNGALVDWLDLSHMTCNFASDLKPQRSDVKEFDAFTLRRNHLVDCEVIITNPPWSRKFLHRFIEFLMDEIKKPTFLLFDSDWMHTKQSIPYVHYLKKIISVGRLKWIEGSPHTGKDNCCWHLLDHSNQNRPKFFGRIDKLI
jgi:hypothetical protein